MSLIAIAQAAEMMEKKQAVLTEADREFVCQFAFATGDKELTDKLIDELCGKEADRDRIFQKYSTIKGFQPDWVRTVENLLVALEMYRLQEQKAVQTISEILAAYGVDITVDELKEMPPEQVREHFEKQAMTR